MNVAEVQSDWDHLIKEAREKPSPFEVINVSQDDFLNINKGLEPYFFKQSRPAMKIKGIRMLKIKQNEDKNVFVRDSYSGPWLPICIRNKKKMSAEQISFEPLY